MAFHFLVTNAKAAKSSMRGGGAILSRCSKEKLLESKAIIACVIAVILIVLASRAFAQDSCFPRGDTYAKRLALIREEPGFPNAVIGLANRAGIYGVLHSTRVGGKCWAQVEDGWLLTDDLSVEPVPTPDPRTPSIVTWLKIKGDPEFRTEISRGLAYLLEKSPRWYRYVTLYPYSIEPTKPGAKTSWGTWPDRIVYIHRDTFISSTRLARALVHEACHIQQGIQGRLFRPGERYREVRNEQECVRMALQMVLDIEGYHSEIMVPIYVLSRPDWWWWVMTRGDPSLVS